jgi:hypothetical protein
MRDKAILNVFYTTSFWENKLCVAYNSLLHSGALQITKYLSRMFDIPSRIRTPELISNTDYRNVMHFIVDYGPLAETNAAMKC